MSGIRNYIFNPETLLYEEADEPKIRRILRALAFAVGAVALASLYLWLYLSVFGLELPKTVFLKMQNARWAAKMEILGHQMDRAQLALKGVEERDDEVYRSIFGLNAVSEELKNSGIGGVNRYADLVEQGASPLLLETMKRLDLLSKRTYVQSRALDEIAAVSRNAGDMVSCIPSVMPVCPDRGKVHLTSPFGYRTDPIRGHRARHEGQDFGCAKGTPVYAPGDGVVEVTGSHFRGYGNEIIINHGYGYKTHYAHLNTIEVVEGMSVHRGQRIGTVGSTGKSTGPHLHYEVIYKGARVNPARYFDPSIPQEEYKAMIAEHNEDVSRRPSTSDIINRRKR